MFSAEPRKFDRRKKRKSQARKSSLNHPNEGLLVRRAPLLDKTAVFIHQSAPPYVTGPAARLTALPRDVQSTWSLPLAVNSGKTNITKLPKKKKKIGRVFWGYSSMIYEKYFLFRPPNTYRDDACDSCSDYIKLLAINYNMYWERERKVGG